MSSGAIQQEEREQGGVRSQSDLQKGAAPVKERGTATVVFDFVKSSGAGTFETAARISLESSLSAPAIPRSAKKGIQHFSRNFGFL